MGKLYTPKQLEYMEALEWAGKSPVICLFNWSKRDLNCILKQYKESKDKQNKEAK